MSIKTDLQQYTETTGTDAFTLQNSKLLKVRLGEGEIQAKKGSMVAYQGEVKFEHAGSGGMGRMLKKAVSGEGTTLMKMAGSGEVFLADTAQDIHLLHLDDDSVTINGPNLLAFDADISWDIHKLSGGAAAAMAGGLFNMELKGTGWVALLSDGPPVLLDVVIGPDVRRRAGRDHLVVRCQRLAEDGRERQGADRPQLRRVAADGVLGPGLGARPAVRGADRSHLRRWQRRADGQHPRR